MKRRDFITLVGGAAGWPLVARAQQPTMPAIGYLDTGSRTENAYLIAAFRQGLSETGFIEDQNIKVEYRFAEANMIDCRG